jgi:predicted PurR-regulated permease PerM
MGPELYKEIGEPITFILFFALVGVIVYLVAKVIFRELGEILDEAQRHYEHKARRKEQQAYMMHNINQELDEIEATLDVISEAENSDGKITPIWNSKPPKR